MADILDSGSFSIVSVSHEDHPIGVGLILPAFQFVSVGAPAHHWKAHKVGHNKYKLSVSGYGFTGVLDGKVVASIHPNHEAEWEIDHHINHNAYTIALAKESHIGWTVPDNLAKGHQVHIAPIRATASLPPQYAPTQLFKFKKHD